MVFTLWNTLWEVVKEHRAKERKFRERERETKREKRFLEENKCFTMYYIWCTIYIDYRDSATPRSNPQNYETNPYNEGNQELTNYHLTAQQTDLMMYKT